MKITFFYDVCNLGGTESAIKNRMDHLKNLGVECNIIFLYSSFEQVTFKNHEVYVTRDINKIKYIAKDSDVIVNLSLHEPNLELLYKLNKPIILECHCHGIYEHLVNVDKSLVKAVIFPSQSELIYAKSQIQSSIPFFFIYNCIGKDFILNRKLVNKKGNKFLLLWIGRIDCTKNWRFLVNLASRLTDDYVIRIISNTSISAEYTEFLNEIISNGTKERFEIISDNPYDEMVNQYLEAAQNGCYISSSMAESFGMTILEALYLDCPMVISDIESYREIAGDYAYYYKINDLEGCIEGIEKVRKNKSLNNNLGKDIFNKKFNVEDGIRKYVNILENVL
jgi:glycosyltransferase involved in cell wall biosynthesis